VSVDPPSPAVLTERRRFPRLAPPEHVMITVPVVVDAQVVDISAAGALLSTSAALDVGQRAHLRVLLHREPFSAWMEVCRVESGTQQGPEHRQRLGVIFTSVDENSQRTLQRFLRDDAKER
jgi:hypothetical protein